MGGSQAEINSAQLARSSGEFANKAYGVGFQGLQAQQGLLANAQSEPGYVRDAYNIQRVGLTEGGLNQNMGGIRNALAQGQGAYQGGNTQMALAPGQMGAALANALAGSRVQQGLGQIEQANKIQAMKLGLGVEAGSQAMGAAGNELRNIANMPQYNTTYANVLGAANLAGSVYGGFQNQGQPGYYAGPYGRQPNGSFNGPANYTPDYTTRNYAGW